MRCDLCCYTVCQLAKEIYTLEEEHLTAAKTALRYLEGKPDSKLVYGGMTKLAAYCGASFGSNESIEHKSITGVIVILSYATILHRSTIPRTVCGSSTEGELMAIYLTTKDITFAVNI